MDRVLGTLGRLLLWLAALATALVQPMAPAAAQGRSLQFIRDAEIEAIIRYYATPLFQVAGLDPKAIDVYLINDKAINAFVAGGQNLFLNTGLLMAADDPLEVIGVIAHETGHIAGGHIAQRGGAIGDATGLLIASYVLGILGAIASGRGEVAQAVISGGSDLALKGLLSFTRSQEQSADQAALTYLNGSGLSPEGLVSFMEKLRGQEVLLAVNQDPYLSTHPLTTERIEFLEREAAASPNLGRPAPAVILQMHARMRAKLIGFLQSRGAVDRAYPPEDQSLPARYAHAILEYREGQIERALQLIESLLVEWPTDPFFLEMKGQMLFEYGRIAEALPVYEAAVQAMPEAAQIRMMLARSQIEMNDRALDAKAIRNLELVLVSEPRNSFAWRLIATAYGRSGNDGMAALALAEAALWRGEFEDSQRHAERALDLLPRNSPAWLQADDVAREAARRIEQQD